MLRQMTPLAASHGQHVGRFDAYDLAGTILLVACAVGLAALLLKQPAGQRKVWPASTPVELLVIGLTLGAAVLLLHQGVADRMCHGVCWSH
ncbi:MAG: hypothetical protein NVSMB55_09730 [Mycobacteriales bacterium]